MSKEVFIIHNGDLVLKSKDGVTTDEYNALPKASQSVWQGFGSDILGDGVKGIMNHADGKMYDSKSRYTQAVVASGARIVGNDYNKAEYKTPLERGVRGDFNVRPQLKEAVEKVMR